MPEFPTKFLHRLCPGRSAVSNDAYFAETPKRQPLSRRPDKTPRSPARSPAMFEQAGCREYTQLIYKVNRLKRQMFMELDLACTGWRTIRNGFRIWQRGCQRSAG